MKAVKAICILFLLPCGVVAQDLLDPRERDEDLSDTEVSVTVQRTDDGLYDYRYQLDSGDGNKGTITTFMVRLVCSVDFDGYTLPEQEVGGVVMGAASPGEPPAYTPSVVYFDKTRPHGISRSRYALWSVNLEPNASISGMRIVSPAKPGMRRFILKPSLPTGIYDYESLPDDVTEMDLPQGEDFEVTGLIEGPECPGITPPPERPRFSGTPSRPNNVPEQINELLTYSQPLRDRLEVPREQESLELTVHYHDRIDTETFKVEPAWARRLFNAEPGTSETVELPLRGPRTNFRLRVRPAQSESTRGEDDWHHSYQDIDVFEVRVEDHPGNENGNPQQGRNAR